MPWNFEIRDNCWILHVCWFVLYLNSSLILFAVLSAPEELPSTSSLLFDIFYRYHKNKTPKSSTKRNTSVGHDISRPSTAGQTRRTCARLIHPQFIAIFVSWASWRSGAHVWPHEMSWVLYCNVGPYYRPTLHSWQKRGFSAGNASLASPGFRIRIETLVLHNRIKFYANFNGIRVDPAMRLLIISLWRRKKSKMY